MEAEERRRRCVDWVRKQSEETETEERRLGCVDCEQIVRKRRKEEAYAVTVRCLHSKF